MAEVIYPLESVSLAISFPASSRLPHQRFRYHVQQSSGGAVAFDDQPLITGCKIARRGEVVEVFKAAF
jgi:hypothetical protein